MGGTDVGQIGFEPKYGMVYWVTNNEEELTRGLHDSRKTNDEPCFPGEVVLTGGKY